MKSGGRFYTVRIALEIYSHAYSYDMVELCEYANVIEQGIHSTGLKQNMFEGGQGHGLSHPLTPVILTEGGQ